MEERTGENICGCVCGCLMLDLTITFSWKTGLWLGLGTTGMPQAAQHQWSSGGGLPAKGHIIFCTWFILLGGLSRSEGNNKRICQLAYQIPAKPHSEGAHLPGPPDMTQPILPHQGASSPLKQDSCQADAHPTSAPQAFSSSLGIKAHFGQLLTPRASNSYSFGSFLLNWVSWNMRSFNWFILLHVTYNNLCVENHLSTLFSKLFWNDRNYRNTNKHPISLGSECQYCSRVTPFPPQTPPTLSEVQHLSLATEMFEEAWWKLPVLYPIVFVSYLYNGMN